MKNLGRCHLGLSSHHPTMTITATSSLPSLTRPRLNFFPTQRRTHLPTLFPKPLFPTPNTHRLSSSDKNLTVTVDPSSTPTGIQLVSRSASDVVRRFYVGINGRDLASVEGLIAEDCVYEDLIFPRPFVGRKAIMEFFKKFIDSISKDLQFVIDDISVEDSAAIGVTWHLDWKGKEFPFSKGCSFYRLQVTNGTRQIIYARDSVEPAVKPGEAALVAIRGVTWLLQQFPQLADRF